MAKTKKKSPPKKQKTKAPNSSVQKENKPKTEKKVKKPSPNDSIAMSRQLSIKKMTTRANRASSRNNETRLCPNGKPIPSLADLEKMYEDSDEEEPSAKVPPRDTTVTPTPEPAPTEASKLLSPNTINKISQRMIELISNISDPAELLEEITPRPPVIPQKKRKKPDQPYIVGCKDRPQVIKKPKISFCKGDEEYGVNNEEPQDDSPPQKRAKKSKIPKYSKSIFNAKSDEIAEHLKENDDGNESSDSNKTVNYEYMNSSLLQNARPNSFSPLPSTSRDNDTFHKNDQLFNESLKEKDDIIAKTESEPEIIDVPYETIVVEDDVEDIPLPEQIKNVYKEIELGCIEIIDNVQDQPVEVQDNAKQNVVVTNTDVDVDDCLVVEPEPERPNIAEQNNRHIVNEYSDIGLNIPDEVNEDDIIDVDALIAQNQSILEKFKEPGSNSFNNVIDVDASTTAALPVVDNNSEMQRNENLTTTPSFEEEVAPVQEPIEPHREETEHSSMMPSSSQSRQNHNEIEEVVTNFFRNRQNIQNVHTVEPEPEIIDVDDETRIKAVVCTTMDTKCKRKDLESVKSFLNSLLNNFTPRNILKEFSPRKRRAQMTSDDVIEIAPPPTRHRKDKSRHTQVASEDDNVRNPIACITTTVDVRRYPLHTSKKNQIDNFRMDSPEPTTSATKNIGDCPICMDALAGNAIASTICGHVFCLKCIQAAIKANGKRCPTCRKSLRGNGYHQLYL